MRRLLLVTAAASLAAIGVASSQDATMSFFVTSVGSGKGADLGGLAGADAHCASLAEAAGVAGKTWRAYLSTSDTDARDRIGRGPWSNAKGVKIADDVASLHSDANAITKQTALNEKGEMVNGRGDKPNRHDILTGSKPDGTKIADQTCGDWTLSGAEGAAMTGHHDRTGLDDSAAAKSWNSSHASRGGCSQEALRSTGGDGLFYCFAVN
ncbi:MULTISPECIES: hypothetical protein [unclassified Mesorhizobium]|uniref:hypothetical protein n=1 Tax=unclassified Mesorhizobium TaxID=325217 RepID=UPI000FE5E45C|nr:MULTISPECIES: hypothetical protein [unclassified Mesorhizobium]RWI18969.1 MAG: hypothetical protein EOQ92_21810 [Mesorhizobium sp.]RWK50712.1 MAG: hypothetical protein EOR47_10240 [Mesorhizobium sp.]RWK57219.1 MAG: hypothetical protein EOR48_02845 [Mesorhizobium sp.]RWK92880.1 MAG: hypothetical protein EOR53_25935 [Mesorhizobium sp.]RWL14405.1 MAG: hypothetical protein EOR45_00880 [Mesorhizobium sp.]